MEDIKQTFEPKLSREQIVELAKFADMSKVHGFILKLERSFGGGEVLEYKHILNFFSKKLWEAPLDAEAIYIDTYRMLSMSGKDTDIMLAIIDTKDLAD